MGPRDALPRGAQRLPHGYFRGALSGAPVPLLHSAGGDEVDTDFLQGRSGARVTTANPAHHIAYDGALKLDGWDEGDTDIFCGGAPMHDGVTFCIYRRTGSELFCAAGRCSY